MTLQKFFLDFDKAIRLDHQANSELAKKRDVLLEKLNGNDELVSFVKFDQGSYAMNTGVEPLDKDYDIDVGIRFNANRETFDIIELKEQIHEILNSHTDYGAEVKRSCVTVYYKKAGELAYHVDLVPYAYDDKDSEARKLFLAYGKAADEVQWKQSDPLRLTKIIRDKFDDVNQRAQYRRIIRYLKRWKNIVFDQTGEKEPPGIGITILAYNLFKPADYDFLSLKYEYNDLNALIGFIEEIKNQFVLKEYDTEGRAIYNLTVYIPEMQRIEDNNVFRKMGSHEITDFKDQLEKLYGSLCEVRDEPDIHRQCELLNGIFGDDFKVPTKKEVSRKQSKTFVHTTESGS